MAQIEFIFDYPDLEEFVNSTIMFRETLRTMYEELFIMERLFGRQTATWRHKPDWKYYVPRLKTGDLEGKLETDSVPFVWVNEKRKNPGRVLMSKDYRPKTKPRTLGSGPGAGRVLKRGRHAPYKKSFVPREAEYVVAERRQKAFAKKASEALVKDFNRYMRGKGRKQKVQVISIL